MVTVTISGENTIQTENTIAESKSTVSPSTVVWTSEQQEIMGIGGCFNEIGGRELLALNPSVRESVLESLFSPEGCAFNFCRIPIGASDYALDWYSLNETDGDYTMEHFSIARDEKFLIPYIKEAQRINPAIRFFASPWSPPSWLKKQKQYNGSSLRWEPDVLNAYALYLAKFVEAYREKGIIIEQIHVQNEPNSCQVFPSCIWTGEQMRDFIRDYLGPCFEQRNCNCEIWAGTIEKGTHHGWNRDLWSVNRYHNWAHTILSDDNTRKYVRGIGYQWDGKGAVQRTHSAWPDIRIMQTENECGDGKNCWDYTFYVFDLMWQYFNNGCNAYIYWNMLLPPGGESTWGWKQNTMITVEAAAQSHIMNPEFFIMKHLAQKVAPGARFCPTSGKLSAFSLLFKNRDTSFVCMSVNPFTAPQHTIISTPGGTCEITLPPRSIATVVIS